MASKIYTAQNRIDGLFPPRRGPNGEIITHTVKLGEDALLDEDVAKPFVETGSLVPKGAKKLLDL